MIESRIDSREKIDTAVIGGGVIGLAVGRALALKGYEVFLFEEQPRIGLHTSSHNSGVIHSDIHYSKQQTPLKAELSVRGMQMLYAYCNETGVRHKQIGQLLVAVEEGQVDKLMVLKQHCEENGISDLKQLDSQDIKAYEPFVRGVMGLYFPSTGIIDSHRLMESLKRDAVGKGACIMESTGVSGGKIMDDGIELRLQDTDTTIALCQRVINCAGLWASQVANSIEGLDKQHIPQTYYAKGNYFEVDDQPVKYLVYPMPVAGGLGIHATVDLEGRVRFGPDVEWIEEINDHKRYDVSDDRLNSFYLAIRSYLKNIRKESLQPGYAGIRPKLSRPGEPPKDFVISGPKDHRIFGLVNLFGIESPGLTASLAIAEYVADMIAA